MECEFKDIAGWYQIRCFCLFIFTLRALWASAIWGGFSTSFTFRDRCSEDLKSKIIRISVFVFFWFERKLWFSELFIMSYWYPPAYYNHFIEHPILWTNQRRRWEEQRLAHECYSVWKTQERLKRSEKLRSQSEVWKPEQSAKQIKTNERKEIHFGHNFWLSHPRTTLRTIRQSVSHPLPLTHSSPLETRTEGIFCDPFCDNIKHKFRYTIEMNRELFLSKIFPN